MRNTKFMSSFFFNEEYQNLFVFHLFVLRGQPT